MSVRSVDPARTLLEGLVSNTTLLLTRPFHLYIRPNWIVARDERDFFRGTISSGSRYNTLMVSEHLEETQRRVVAQRSIDNRVAEDAMSPRGDRSASLAAPMRRKCKLG